VVRRLTDLAAGLVAVQVLLGAWTVWSNKAADIATLHVVTGAALLVTAALATAWSRRLAGRVTASGPVMGMNPIETTGAAVAVSRG
jgi:heme A synthase